jgi:hypothetical protein
VPKAGKKLKVRCMSVQRVDDSHYQDERAIYLKLECLEGRLILAISAANLRHIAGFSARQSRARRFDAKAKLEVHK